MGGYKILIIYLEEIFVYILMWISLVLKHFQSIMLEFQRNYDCRLHLILHVTSLVNLYYSTHTLKQSLFFAQEDNLLVVASVSFSKGFSSTLANCWEKAVSTLTGII